VKPKITFTCLQCGKEKTVYSNPNSAYKFCSRDCSDSYGRVTITCGVCGKERVANKSGVARGQFKYCSNSCRAKAMLLNSRGVPNKLIVCPICGKCFDGRKDSVTCSVSCQSRLHSKWVLDNQTGENNPFYNKKHTIETRIHLSIVRKRMFADGILVPKNKGKGKGRIHPRAKDLDWRLLRQEIVERDGNRCVLCNSTKRLEVHHIVPYRTCIKHEDSNLATLCRECHKKTYGKEEKFVDILRSKMEDICYG
jgi:hypothetical protein